jgi:hypothetical protein
MTTGRSIMHSLILRNMKHARGFDTGGAATAMAASLPIGANEQLVGVYRNPPPWQTSSLLLTDEAIYAVDQGAAPRRIAWAEIVDYDGPPDKREVENVTVRTRTESITLRIAGSHGPDGKFKDAFSFGQILNVLTRPPR